MKIYFIPVLVNSSKTHIKLQVWVSQSERENASGKMTQARTKAGRVILMMLLRLQLGGFKGKQMFMAHCIINGFDFEEYLGTGPN